MKHSLKLLSLLSLSLFLASCGSDSSVDTSTSGSTASGTQIEKPVVSPEQQALSKDMIKASKDLSTTQVIGNTAFKTYDKLTVKYGKDAKNLDLQKEFSGKDGFVVLDHLNPNTEYTYEIYDGKNRITMGVVKSQEK